MILWYVDLERPEFGETSSESIKQGMDESGHNGPTGYMLAKKMVFCLKADALFEFHQRWPDRAFVEKHVRNVWGEFADQQIRLIYGDES